jgi:hypothetical protein
VKENGDKHEGTQTKMASNSNNNHYHALNDLTVTNPSVTQSYFTLRRQSQGLRIISLIPISFENVSTQGKIGV